MKLPNSYCYPAVLTYEDGYEIAVTFPDFPGCATSGETEADALHMAQEALCGHIFCMEDLGEEIPTASSLKDIPLADNQKATLVHVYMPSIRLAEVNKSVNQTVTLPAWLNAAAMERGINFSQVLQESIKQML